MKNILILTAAFIYLACNAAISQNSSTLGNIAIHQGATMSIFGDHSFDYGGNIIKAGIVKTARVGEKGRLHFADSASWNNANELQYVDGYVSTSKTQGFTFPIGQDGSFKPVAVHSGVNGTKAAYFLTNPLLLTSVPTTPEIEEISTVEFWDISGSSNASVTLTWDRDSDIRTLVNGDLSKLTMVGWNGAQWVVIPSQSDEFKLDKYNSQASYTDNNTQLIDGSISTLGDINLDMYEYFTFAKLNTEFANFINNQDFDKNEISLFVFPNPASTLDEIKVSYSVKNFSKGEIHVLDMAGKLMYTKDLNRATGMETIDSDLVVKSGNYYVRIITDDNNKVKPVVVVD